LQRTQEPDMQEQSLGLSDSKSNPHLFKKAVKGGGWVMLIRVFTQFLSFIRYIILARILMPEDFGLMGIAFLLIDTLDTFTNTGFQAALIQKKEKIDDYLNVAWTIGLIRAVILFSVVYFAAPLVVVAKVSPERVDIAVNIIRVMGIMLLLNSLSNIGTVYFSKDLRFNLKFMLDIPSTLLSIVVSVCVVYMYKTVWAIVIGKLSGVALRCVLSYCLAKHRPRLSLDMAKAGELWGFGKWIFSGTILGFLMTQGDDIFVLGYLGAFSLALYQMAYKFASVPATEISNVVSHVAFPAFSKIQDDIPRLREAYLKILQVTSFLSMPVGGLIVILSPDFVRLFLTDKWILIILPMQILAVQGILRSLGTLRGPLFKALGRPEIGTKLLSLRLVLFAILIYPLTKLWGISGTSLSIVLVSIIVYPIGFFVSRRLIQAKTKQLLKPIVVPLASTLVMIASIWLCDIFFQNEIGFVLFFVKALLAAAVYLIVIIFCERFLDYGIVKVFKSQLKVFTERKASLGVDGE
jgi:lipopolysaccharide exporter